MTPTFEAFTSDSRSSTIPVGLTFFNTGMELLDSFSLTRSADQRRFHDAIMVTMAPHILKSDYLFMREDLLRRFDMQSQNMATLILCPRRWGKSTSVSMALAVLLRVCRGVNIVIFSTGEDSSSTLLQMTKDFFFQLPGCKDRITINRRDMLATLPADAETGTNVNSATSRSRMTCNTILARSGNVTGNRGITADCFILEEAAYIPRGILTQIIAPMLKVSNSVLIAISTHNGEENYYSRLMLDPDPIMDRLFIRLRVDLVCASCKRRGLNPNQCTHKAFANPAWLLGSNESRVKKLIGDEETYAREVMGAFMSNRNGVFQASWLEHLDTKPPRPLDRVRHRRRGCFLFSMIDPAGGGDSASAIVTILREREGTIVVVGLSEARILEGPQMMAWCKSYMAHFANDPVAARIPHWVACERNYGGSVLAANFVAACQAGSPQIMEHRTEPDKHGTWTCPEVNKTGTMTLMFELHDHRVHFSPFIATDRPFRGPQDVGAAGVGAANAGAVMTGDAAYCAYATGLRKTLLEQLGQFRKVFKASGSWTYTGKDNRGGRDDLAMCLVMGVYHSVVRAVALLDGPA